MNSPIDFCEKWCGNLSEIQKNIIEEKCRNNSFVGCAFAPGTLSLLPCYSIKDVLYVIDENGYYQLASNAGKKIFVKDLF